MRDGLLAQRLPIYVNGRDIISMSRAEALKVKWVFIPWFYFYFNVDAS